MASKEAVRFSKFMQAFRNDESFKIDKRSQSADVKVYQNDAKFYRFEMKSERQSMFKTAPIQVWEPLKIEMKGVQMFEPLDTKFGSDKLTVAVEDQQLADLILSIKDVMKKLLVDNNIIGEDVEFSQNSCLINNSIIKARVKPNTLVRKHGKTLDKSNVSLAAELIRGTSIEAIIDLSSVCVYKDGDKLKATHEIDVRELLIK